MRKSSWDSLLEPFSYIQYLLAADSLCEKASCLFSCLRNLLVWFPTNTFLLNLLKDVEKLLDTIQQVGGVLNQELKGEFGS